MHTRRTSLGRLCAVAVAVRHVVVLIGCANAVGEVLIVRHGSGGAVRQCHTVIGVKAPTLRRNQCLGRVHVACEARAHALQGPPLRESLLTRAARGLLLAARAC